MRTGPALQDSVTFNDVAPIIYEHCAPCHRPGQLAPFSLLTYADVQPNAERIAALTARRVMPPWPPEPGYGEFSNERLLSNQQIDLIQQWVRQGATEGDPGDGPTPPTWSDEWQLGSPDLALENPGPYTLQAEGTDVFRNFVIPLPTSWRGTSAVSSFVRGTAGWCITPSSASTEPVCRAIWTRAIQTLAIAAWSVTRA